MSCGRCCTSSRTRRNRSSAWHGTSTSSVEPRLAHAFFCRGAWARRPCHAEEMSQIAAQNILVIGDHDRHVTDALLGAAPGAQVTAVATYFDAIAELSGKNYTTVMASAEPIERRPDAAMKT